MPLLTKIAGRTKFVLAFAAIMLAVTSAARTSTGHPAVHAAPSQGSADPSSSQGGVSAATASSLLFGTLDTQLASISADKQAGVSVAMFELDWSRFEPEQGHFNSAYIAGMKSFLTSFRSAGMRITLGLGLEDPPSWISFLPDARYINESGHTADEADLVFSEPVREAAAAYLKQVATALPLSEFWSVRLTSGGDGEMLYPAGGSYWAFSQSALTGTDLPPTMKADPFPKWRPGRSGLTPTQIDRWVNWYVGGLDDVTCWQMSTLSSLGFTGYYELVTPGSGTRPDALAAQEQSNLPDDAVTGVGAVWDRYYAMLPDKSKVVAYVSSVADTSGDDDSCHASDESLPLTSQEMDTWSATRWISRVAAANGLPVGGENPGFGMPASLDSHYRDTSSHGMMADAIRQATTCKFQVFYWAHDSDFSSGIIPLSLYREYIARAHKGLSAGHAGNVHVIQRSSPRFKHKRPDGQLNLVALLQPVDGVTDESQHVIKAVEPALIGRFEPCGHDHRGAPDKSP